MIRPVLGLLIVCGISATSVVAQEVLRRTQAAEETRASWLVGANIVSTSGESIGSIDDLLIDEEDGTVTGAIVTFGGFLGFGSKAIAVDWNELQISYDGNEVILPITPQQAEEAEEFAFRDRQYPPPPPDIAPAADPVGGGFN